MCPLNAGWPLNRSHNFMLIGYNSSVQNWEAANGRKKKVVEDGEEAGDRGTSSERSWKISASLRNWNWQAETISVSPGPHYFVLTFKSYQKDKNVSQWWFPTLIYNQCSKWTSIITFLKYRKIYFFVPCILFCDKYSTTFHFPSSWETGSKLVAESSARQTALKFVM